MSLLFLGKRPTTPHTRRNGSICPTDGYVRRSVPVDNVPPRSSGSSIHSPKEGQDNLNSSPWKTMGDGIVPVSPAKEQSRPVPLYMSVRVLARAPLCAQWGWLVRTPPPEDECCELIRRVQVDFVRDYCVLCREKIWEITRRRWIISADRSVVRR